MWKIVLSHAWFKCQCILMIPWLSFFCNKHQYWNWLRDEDRLCKAELISLFWKGGYLVSSWYIWIMEMRTQSSFNHSISMTFHNMSWRSWIYRRRRRGMMWKIVLSHTWFKCQCILMIPWLSFCNKHQYWDRLRCEVQLSKTVLRWLFWKGGHLVSSWYITISEWENTINFQS